MNDYKNPKTGLSGVYATHKRFGGTIDNIKKKLNEDSGYQINKQGGRTYYFPIRGRGIGSYQVDLMFPPPYKGIDTLLCCINVNSRYAYVYPLRGKKNVYDAMEKIINDADDDKRPIVYLQSDKGSEFNNYRMKQLFEDNDISYNTVKKADHAGQGKVERFNGTLRRLITIYCSVHDTNNWVEVLDDLVYNYNHRVNRMMGTSPIKANEYMQMLHALEQYKKAKQQFDRIKVGDKVRLLKDKDIFDKGRKEWSQEIYNVDGIDHNTFLVDGKRLKHYEVQKIVNGVELSKEHEKDIIIMKNEKRQKRALNKEGVDVSNIVTRNATNKREAIKFDETLIGKRVKKGKREGTIEKYDKEGPYHFFVKFDNGDSEYFNKKEVKLYLITIV